MSLVTYHFSPIGALPISKPQPTFVIGPTVSPTSASRLSIFAILNQDEPTDNLKVSTTMGLQDNRHKAALSFILSSSDAKSEIDQRKTRMRELRHESAGVKRMRYVKEIPESPQLTLTRPSASKHEGKKGSKFCSVEGCSSRAKHAKRCWKHGGWVRCKVLDCTNRAKCKGSRMAFVGRMEAASGARCPNARNRRMNRGKAKFWVSSAFVIAALGSTVSAHHVDESANAYAADGKLLSASGRKPRQDDSHKQDSIEVLVSLEVSMLGDKETTKARLAICGVVDSNARSLRLVLIGEE
ncbi:uncharacterized protein PHALS_02109 [Plasmopara halstedii]|uniref:Uncharacterized protein n=1 Tax=Plasmopara halstedii TaxID=4781 RepID=A0A0P1AVN7_PLAHL|nr:uncharacterized protein PHALS_02109 [Plasmopara halstedii]CEG45838.1 hypothetical protein PHALS_02109 [Plasmopara halstedii]|eukprot:XP_024582207.1 hypothetical protein PHALS_02109 [Plasmopara halstedii]